MDGSRIWSIEKAKSYFFASFKCAGHGTNSVGDKPTTGSYRQV